ncbi:MAG TPA: hypothetical protein VLM40_22075, partial [Gemmata sp.]|nr:hypothetical protein [Gemmata sp.]
RVLARGTPVNVPPIHIVKSYMPVTNQVTPASGNFGSSAAPDWGTASPQPAARGGVAKPFVVPTGGMSMRGVARLTLGTEQRWNDIYILNPHLKPDQILAAGTELKLPPEARLP